MKHHVLARFPEHAQTIEALNQTNPLFEELCQKYGRVVETLRGLTGGGKSAPAATDERTDVELLRKRRAALEEELLLTINSNRP
jgi:hypothetical protein